MKKVFLPPYTGGNETSEPIEIKKSDEKVLRAIEATEKFIKEAKQKGTDQTISEQGYGTIYGCEVRNLEAYKEMLGQDKRKLTDWMRELYQAI